MKPKKVLLANIVQESCSFVPTRSDLDYFRRFYLLFDEQVLEQLRSSGIEVSGIIKAAEEDHIELIPTVATYAGAGGLVTDEANAFLQDRVLEGARRHKNHVDGVILALHGAMATPTVDDPEGELLAQLRGILGQDIPIVCSLDMHAHITEAMVKHSTALVGYHTHPHVDHYDAGYRAMKLLSRVMTGQAKPYTAHKKLRMIAPPEKHNTSRLPMVDIMTRILEMEQEPDILAAAVFAPPLIDVPHLGWSLVVTSDNDPSVAEACTGELARMAWERRYQFLVQKTPVDKALRHVSKSSGGPFILSDSNDSTSGGAPGDSTWLLKGLLETPVQGRSLLLITDPEAVATCIAAGVGEEVSLDVGGKLVPDYSQPVHVTGKVRTISDGKYQMKLPPIPADRGRTVVLQINDIYLVISEEPTNTFDEEYYRAVGLFPREAKLVQVKSGGGFRPIYEPFAKEIILLDTPGPIDSDLTRLPFHRVTRPLFPLDEVEDASTEMIVHAH